MSIVRLLCAILLVPLFGCGDRPDDSQVRQSLKEQLAEIASAQENPVTPDEVSEVFALGSDFTDLQRDLLSKELIGSVVEWNIQVYEIGYADGVYKVTSQPISIKSRQAVNMLRATIFIHPQNEQDHELLRKAKTNDMIKIRGRVQDIVLRTVAVIEPAFLVTIQSSMTQITIQRQGE